MVELIFLQINNLNK